jgi:hypothetical protein
MKAAHVLACLLATLSLSAIAFPGDGYGRGEFRSRVEGIRAEMFGEFKAIESYSHHERIRILQEAEVCIQAATNRDQYRACEEREQQAREQVKTQVKARHDALRTRAEAMRQGQFARAR